MPTTAHVETVVHRLRAAEAHRARRGCLVTTRDLPAAFGLLEQAATLAGRPLHHLGLSAQRRFDLTSARWERVGGPVDAGTLLERALELDGLVIFDDLMASVRDDHGQDQLRHAFVHALTTEAHRGRALWCLVEAPEAAGRLPALLSGQLPRIDLPFPHAPELQSLAREELAVALHQHRLAIEPSTVAAAAPRLGAALAGLSRTSARELLQDVLVTDPRDIAEAVARLERQKRARLEQDLSMRVLDQDSEEFPIGLERLEAHLETALPAMRREGSGRARGVLLIGPPGTGKTMLARAVGRLVGLPVVEFRISSLMNSLLGETERRFAQAFAALEAMAPNVVFIDEIEKAFGDSTDRDGGTMMRCTGALLSWLSDNRRPNYIVATSNSLRRMGEIGLTMTRSERFDAAYFVDVPTRRAREAMLVRWLREGGVGDPAPMASTVASETAAFSGADLRSLVKQACFEAEAAGRPIELERLLVHASRKRARAQGLHAEFDDLRRWASLYCEPAGEAE